MPKGKGSSPSLKLEISEEHYEQATQSKSGGCLIADAIKRQYPEYSSVKVDMVTVRFTDRAAGERYVYLTPQKAQLALLYYDQGWPQREENLTIGIRRAVQIIPVIASPKRTEKRAAQREERRSELEGKVDRGEELTPGEKNSLTKLHKPYNPPTRPATTGAAEIVAKHGARDTIRGGAPRQVGQEPHPNLLRGRDRIFGAKLADPGEAFRDAVEEAVAARLATPDV